MSHIVQIPELEQGPYTYTETLLVSTCAVPVDMLDMHGSPSSFAGYITEEELEEMDELDEKRGDDFMADFAMERCVSDALLPQAVASAFVLPLDNTVALSRRVVG